MKYLSVFTCGALLLLGACTNFSGGKDNEETRIGVILPLSGPRAFSGRKTLDGISLAYDQIKQQGPIRGKSLKLLIFDNNTSVQGSREAMQKCADAQVSMAIAACSTANALALKPLADKLQIPVLLTLSTGNIVTERSPYMFRCCFTDNFQARVLAAFTAVNKQYSEIGVFLDLNDQVTYRRDLGREFAAAFKKITGNSVQEIGYYSGTKDFSAPLLKLKNSKLPAIFVPGDISDAGSILKQARQMGIYKVFLGSDGWDQDELFVTCGPHPEPCIVSSMFSAESDLPGVKEFNRSIKARTGSLPGVDCAQAYDALRLAVKALKLSNKPDDVRSGLYQIKDFPGVTGNISINAEGNAEKTVFIKKIVKQADGSFAFALVKSISPQK
ncbi:MAG: ABC transporter substrate-binding protein [Victivallales bacterium]|nr:ABC transporter substrate-binding protein [Victivallales bacterium]